MASSPSTSPPLLRQLGLVSAAALVVSNMIGAGIFGTTGFMAAALGDAWLILAAWTVGGLFAMAGAFSYSELGVNLPSSGGEYVYLTRAYGPMWGYMTGWASFFAGFSAPIATAALIFSSYLGYFFPVLDPARTAIVIGSGAFSLRLGGAQLGAAALIAAFTLLNCFGVARVARIQNFLTALKVLVIVVFVASGFAYGSGSWDHFSQPTTREAPNALAVAFVIQLFFVMVGYSGWNAATYVAEELKQPEKTLPAALALGSGLVLALYLGLNLVFIYSTPLDELKGVVAVGMVSAQNLFGDAGAAVFSGLMAVSIMSTVNAMVTIGPRVYYAMAQNGAFPAAAARVHPRFRTPIVAIVSQGVCAILMTLTPIPDLFVFIGFSLTFFSVLAVASVFRFRRRPGWQRLRAVDFCFPLVPAAYIVVGAGMIVYGMIFAPVVSVAALATIGLGGAVYHLTKVK
ncbi:MAG: amino acid permease [Bryobacterales bacterium]|nr:amino acid permease [Bryobacterales bacterium]